jgi:hypothetical protein
MMHWIVHVVMLALVVRQTVARLGLDRALARYRAQYDSDQMTITDLRDQWRKAEQDPRTPQHGAVE